VNSDTRSILDALAENAGADFERARSLPPRIYHDPEILRLEEERLFRAEWICIGRLAEMPKPGDYVCRDIVDSPVVVIRQSDGTVKAFANVCLHRAARLLDGVGHVSRISCPYHSWTYERDGQLIGAPFMEETADFCTSDFRLKELPSATWEGFVYVSLNTKPTDLAESLQPLSGLVGDFRMGDYVPVFEQTETWNTNWKCLAENYMDAYHVHRVHKDSFRKYGHSEDITALHPGGDQYAYHVVQEHEGRQSVFAHPGNTWLKGDDRYKMYLVHIFPSHLMQLQPDLLWYLSLLPEGVGKVSIRWGVSIPAEILDNASDRQGAIDAQMALIDQVNAEDRPIVENVFRATASPHAVRGPLSWLERNVWDFGRYLARNLC
jgi:phenylpropionate dioxygenase-like ring-hydroxylating dioxygenase large terminal subunit